MTGVQARHRRGQGDPRHEIRPSQESVESHRDEGRKLSDVQDNNAQLFRARAVLSRPERDKWWCQCWKPIPRSAGDAVVLFETKYFFSRFVRTYDLPP